MNTLPRPPSPLPPPSLYVGLISYNLFRWEVYFVLGLQLHDTQLHVLNFFSTLSSSTLWRIVTICLLLEKAVEHPGTTSPPSRNLAPVGKNSILPVMRFTKLSEPPPLFKPPPLPLKSA